MSRLDEASQYDEDELRCHCGRMVARRVGQDIEIRCQRCKRILLISLQPDGSVRVREPA